MGENAARMEIDTAAGGIKNEAEAARGRLADASRESANFAGGAEENLSHPAVALPELELHQHSGHAHSVDFEKSVNQDKFNYASPEQPKFTPYEKSAPGTPFPTLPDRYKPVVENFSGTKVTGISREFLRNLQTDPSGNYYGAGLEYPDLMADPEMKKYLEDENKATLSRIDRNVLDQEVQDEKKAASYKLPPEWDSGANSQSLNAIDVSLGDRNGSMNVGSQTFRVTDDGAPHRKLVVEDDGGFKTVIPEPKDFVIEQVIQVSVDGANKFAVVGSKDGASVLYVYDGNGNQETQVPLPGYGTLHDARAGSSQTELQFLYDSPIAAPRVLTLDLAGDKSSFSPASTEPFNSDNFVTEKLMVPYTDREGHAQAVPVFVSHNKDVKLDGKNPAMLDIYGGFNIAPQWLKYYPHSAAWLARGGIVVDPILPGDGGLGEDNYQAGKDAGIENTRLAIEAAVKKIQDMGLTSPEMTGIYGRSNGGMVVNAVLNQRPDLFGAAVSESGVDSLFDSPVLNVDTGRYWQDEFGDPQDANDVGWMAKLDDLTNLSAKTQYPPTLIEIGTLDGVVNAGNGITLTKIRRQMNNGEVLLYTREGEGHDPNSLDLQSAFLWDRLIKAKTQK